MNRPAAVPPAAGPARPHALDLALALAALAAYAIFFYRDVLLHDRVYVFRDLVTFFYAIEHSARRLAEWQWPPLWNPFLVLGRPFAADPLAGAYYPPNWFLRLLPVATGFNLSLVLHHTWGAWGALLLARHLGMTPPAALLAGLLFGFAGPMVSCDNLNNGLLAAAWGPWVVLAFATWSERPSFSSLAAAALALAMSTLAAMPEFTLFTNAIAVALIVARRWRDGARAVSLGLAAVVGANLLALALCGAQLIPAAELVRQSSRAAGLNPANALQHSLPPAGVLAFAWPQRLDGGPPIAGGATFVSAAQAPWMLTLYFGPALALALLAALRRGGGGWALLGLAFLALALGEHLPGYAALIERFGWLRVVRYPEKFLIAVHGLAAVGAGAGLDALLRARRPALAAGLAGAVLLFTGADLYRANARLLPSAPWDEIASPPASLRLMRADGDPLRIYGNAVNLPPLPPYPEGLLLEKDLMLMETASLFDVANLNAPTTINLLDHESLAVLIESIAPERVAPLLGALNTAYVTSVKPLTRPGLDLVRAPATALESFVYRVAPLARRAYVAPRARFTAGPAQALELLRRTDSPAEDVVIESPHPGDLPEESRGQVSLLRYLPSRVELRASLETAGAVILGDTHAPGWTASIDGRAAPILRANRFARAVLVGPGDHAITFEYMPRSHRLGLALTLAGAAALAGGVLHDMRSRRLRRTRAS